MPPNVLWIVTTQWRAQATGYAGDPNARTPCLDALALRSLNFRQAVTPHPFGPFARAALLTGLPSPENGVRDYFDPLPSDAVTIAHRLRAKGFRTGFFGKWHLGRRDPKAPLVGDAHAMTIVAETERGGFEYWEGFEGGFLLNDPYLHGTALPKPVRVRGYQSDVVCSQAAEWIAAHRPPSTAHWFAMVSLEPPHPPYEAPAAGIRPAEPERIELRANVPRGGDVETKARRELAGYYAHIEATDRAVGRLLDQAARQATRPTLVVFTSVHGDMHGSHGLFRKGWPHEESVRVPLLVHLTGGSQRGTVSDDAVSLVDLPALMLEAVDSNDPIAAVMAARAGKLNSAISMPSVVPLDHQCDRIWHGVRSKTQKRITCGRAPWLNFDLERDPDERLNLDGSGP